MRCSKHLQTEDPEVPDFETAVDSMSLVKNDELEISVAVAGIVSKVTSQFSLPVMQLTRRIDSLCPNRTVTERLNPLGPHQLGAAFVAATDCIEIDIRVRIVLLKLFERFVMEHLGQAYEDANRLLAEAGVLTDLRNVLKRESNTRRLAPTQALEATEQPNRGGRDSSGSPCGFCATRRFHRPRCARRSSRQQFHSVAATVGFATRPRRLW